MNPRELTMLRQLGLPLRGVRVWTSSELLNLIELEAERCSLDSRGAFTDEHYSVTRSMHRDDMYSQMWVVTGWIGLRAELVVLFIQILTRISNGKNQT
jgi:hypothetical protein